MNVPADLKYTDSHEWVKLDGDVATVGITDHAQSELGDIVFVDLPSVGKKVSAGDTIAGVESVKTVSDVYAPVAGEIVSVNDGLGSASELINSDPYGKGYIVKIKVSDASEIEKLHDAASYTGLVG